MTLEVCMLLIWPSLTTSTGFWIQLIVHSASLDHNLFGLAWVYQKLTGTKLRWSVDNCQSIIKGQTNISLLPATYKTYSAAMLAGRLPCKGSAICSSEPIQPSFCNQINSFLACLSLKLKVRGSFVTLLVIAWYYMAEETIKETIFRLQHNTVHNYLAKAKNRE